MTKGLTREQIQEALRMYGGKSIEIDTLDKDFYIYTGKFEEGYLSMWGDFEQVSELDLQRSNKIIFHFPIKCPEEWLGREARKFEFVRLFRGATTPFGFYSTIKSVKSLKEAVENARKFELKETSQYGIHGVYLGRRVR